ncbi:MAG: flotillin family protein [Verrucomicrobia bacterium]|nr:flotillin family protein [Verrucomicrobiota bacterium]
MINPMLLTLIAQVGRSSRSGAPVGLILSMILAAAVIVLFISFAKRYKRCPSNRILVIYGKTNQGAARCIHGGAAFVWPLIQAYDFLDLEPFVVPIDLKNALSFENIRVTVPTTVTAAVSTTSGIMQNAAIRLLGLSAKEIEDQAQDIILGQMRAVIATMKIEEINQDRQAFLAKVNEAVSGELEKIGLSLINVNIRDIEDESGYIIALGRRAAAEAINQANVDVAEQEKTGKTGVAERNRDQRIAVAAANADAEIGEATADKERRTKSAALDAGAVEGETEADAAKAAYRANQSVAEESARNRAESAAREADGAIRVAQEVAEKLAEEARAEREQARLNAEVVVPANAEREKVVISADAEKQKAVRIAEGEAQATLARMTAEGKGVQAILDGKAEGYQRLVDACNSGEQAASLLLIEKLQEISRIQAQAIQDLPIDKIFVWDTGGENQGMSGLGQRMMGALPPMHELAKQIGLDLPEYLGKTASEKAKPEAAPAE